MGGRNVVNVVWLRRSARRESESGAGIWFRGGGDEEVAMEVGSLEVLQWRFWREEGDGENGKWGMMNNKNG
jgi:hypothetical protein